MFGRNTMLSSVAAFVLSLALVVEAGADGRSASEHDDVRTALQRGELLPLEKILSIAKQHVPGDVIKIEIERDDGLIVYEIKVLAPNGRVRELELDARTGKVLDIEDD